MHARILVPVDGSAAADAGLTEALRIETFSGAVAARPSSGGSRGGCD